MKKKHIKFKPLQELYDHGDGDYTLLNSNSKALGLSEVSLENSTVYQALAEELSRERKGHRQLPSSEANTVLCTSCQSSYSEEFQSPEYSKAPRQPEDLPMLHSEISSQTTDVFDFQCDNSSCISKDDGTTMISGDHFGSADQKNVTYSAPSVSSSCPDVLEKSLNGQTIRIGCPAHQLLVEDDDTSSKRAHKYSNEAQLPSAGLSDGLGPSLKSFRDERDELDHKIIEKSCVLANTEAGLTDQHPSATVLNKLDGNEYLKPNTPITSTQEPHLLSENVMCGNGSEELVDVRVCDICGDLGREALLALCSKCSDGAEHIYCMSPKMDKVPEGDWLCEECMLARDPKRPRQAMLEQSHSPSKPSCLNELSQGSLTIKSAVQHVYERRENHMSRGSCLSDKRLGSAVDVRSELKKRSVARSVKPLKAYGSRMKTQSTRASSLKSLDKGKDSARQVSSFVDLPAKKVVKQTCSSGDRSPKLEQKFCGGSLKNGKSVNSSTSNMDVRNPHLVYRRRSSAKEKNYVELKKDHSDKKVLKALSSTVGPSIPMDASHTHVSVSSKKDLRYGSGKKYDEKCYSVAKKTNQQVLSVADSSPMKAGSSRTKAGSKSFKVEKSSKRNVEEKKSILVNGNANFKARSTPVYEDENCAKPLVSGPIKERKSSCHSSYAINPSVESVNADCDQKVNGVTKNSEVDNLTRDKNDDSVALHTSQSFGFNHAKGLPTLVREDIEHMAPFALSAVPESSCIWMGIFKVEKSRELPTDCCGVQAHLSTRASSKVAELAHKFSPEILLKEVPRLNSWPIQFQKNHPTEQDIALYFFAQDLWSYGRRYKMLLESMTSNDLALEASFGGFQLLVFPSSLLPARSQCWNTLPFLWGVLRARKADVCSLSPPSLNIETLNKGLHSVVTSGTESNFVSVPVTGSAFAGCTSHHSLQGSEYVGPVVLESPALVKSEDQSIEHEDPSVEKHIVKLQSHGQADTDTDTFTHAWRKEDSGRSVYKDDLQNGNRFSVEDPKSVSIIDIARNDQSTREYTTTIGFCPNEIYFSTGFTGFSDSAPEPWQRHDFGSGISFSLDSGPSGSSDGGGGAKSADESQVEPLNNDLDLNLCLGNGAKSEATIDLDLTLGIPTRSKYQPKHLFKDGSRPDGDVSLVLSL